MLYLKPLTAADRVFALSLLVLTPFPFPCKSSFLVDVDTSAPLQRAYNEGVCF